MYRAGLVFSVTALALAHSYQQPSACRLLQVAEIESAVGGKALTQPTGSRQSVPGMDLDVCSVEISGSSRGIHRVDINIVTNLQMDAAMALRVRNAGTAREDQWKVSGARLSQETVGNAICILYGRPGTVGHSICSIAHGMGYVEVDVTGAAEELVPMATVRALLQKALARL